MGNQYLKRLEIALDKDSKFNNYSLDLWSKHNETVEYIIMIKNGKSNFYYEKLNVFKNIYRIPI